MKIQDNKISLTTDGKGQISSINYDGVEILHDGVNHWQKIFPMIWPQTSFSTGFEVNGKNYVLPKHGFWKELAWDEIIESDAKIVQLATHIANDVYPYSIDIQNNIEIKDDSIEIKTVFSNLSKTKAYFQFGLHPAFRINENSVMAFKTKQKPLQIGNDGKLAPCSQNVLKTPLMSIPFGTNGLDTIVFKETDFKEVSYNYDSLNVLITFDAPHLQIWKPKDANFVCIEPWYNPNDKEYDAPAKVEKKKEMLTLEFGEVKEYKTIITIKKNAKA